MEGTNLTVEAEKQKPTPTETELERDFTRLFEETAGRVFVSWSSMNIDRTETLYRACKNARRVLVPDLFCMMVLMRLKGLANIPHPEQDGGNLCAVVTTRMRNQVERLGEPDIVEYLKKHWAAIGAYRLAATPRKWVK